MSGDCCIPYLTTNPVVRYGAPTSLFLRRSSDFKQRQEQQQILRFAQDDKALGSEWRT